MGFNNHNFYKWKRENSMFDFKKLLLIAGTVVFLTAFSHLAFATDELRIVTTTKTFASLVQTIGGDLVRVDYVASPNQNVHFIQPRPSDILRLSKADLFVHAGLDLELWRYPLAEASGKPELLPGRERELDLSKGIRLLEIPEQSVNRLQGDIHVYGNPHYWLDPQNGRIIAQTIYEKLAEIAPAHKEQFKINLDQFVAELDRKVEAWKRESANLKELPVVAYHNSWPYLAEFVGFEVVGFVEPKPGIPPSPQHVTRLLKLMRDRQVPLIIKESYFENRTPEKLAKQTNANVLTLAHGVGENKEITDYISLFDHNMRLLTSSPGTGKAAHHG
jgi:zinc/manganese transport system substrate-binding protein